MATVKQVTEANIVDDEQFVNKDDTSWKINDENRRVTSEYYLGNG